MTTVVPLRESTANITTGRKAAARQALWRKGISNSTMTRQSGAAARQPAERRRRFQDLSKEPALTKTPDERS
jgi:hypothetical protein